MENPPKREIVYYLIISLGVIGFILKFGFLIWSLDKGFDLADESQALLFYRFPELHNQILQQYHYYLLWIFSFINLDIINARILNIVVEVISNIVLLVLCFRIYSRFGNNNDKVLVTSIALTGFFLSTIYPSIMYYQPANLLIGLITLVTYNGSISSGNKRNFYVLACGFFASTLFLIKFSSAIVIIFLSVLAYTFLYENKQKLKHLFLFLTGATAGFCFFLVIRNDSLPVFLNDYLAGFKMVKLVGYNPLDIILDVYWNTDIKINFWLLVPAFAFFAAAVMLKDKYETLNKFKKDYYLTGSLVLSIGILVAVHVLKNHETELYNLNGFIYRVPVIYFLCILNSLFLLIYEYIQETRSNRKETLKNFSFFFFILFLPFVGFVGSDTPFTDQGYEHIFAWFALAGIVTGLLSGRFQLKVYSLAGFLLLFSVSMYQFYHFKIHPYYLSQDIFSQTYPIPGHPEIKVDKPTHEFLDKTKTVIEKYGYKKGDPVLALTNMSGLIYFLDAYPPGFSLFYDETDKMKRDNLLLYNCNHLKQAQLPQLPVKPIILIKDGIPSELMNCLTGNFPVFPGEYMEAGTVTHPLDGKQVNIFVHRDIRK